MLGESATVNCEMLQRLMGNIPGQDLYRERGVEIKPNTERPPTSKTDDTVEIVKILLMSDRRFRLKTINTELNFNQFMRQTGFTIKRFSNWI